MQPIVVSDLVAVGEFPPLDQLDILAKAGFRALINCQPDGEVERFPWSGEIAAAAEKAGLAYAYAPLASRTPDADQLAAFARATKELEAPIYAFCYSGARAAAACALLAARQPGAEADAIVADFARAGFDVSSLTPWIDEACGPRKAPAPAAPAVATAAPAPESAKPAPVKTPIASGIVAAPAAATAPAAVPKAASEPQATPTRPPVQGIVIQPRAASFGGFAV